ncbi:MAG: Stage V sporulation protein E [Candidatus Curtissbacteria bacterium GW2011_GWC2_38_9]|uniref:Probable peptidoglycan glycosyltransferase FtsW n=1 Tax=Candidatus Curtissbacteria bacterium GW2011_GWC2_38_9 TaxID=1618414 RepID=A0A0G0PLM2_9BACT|nr:MAG: Stage V sporulation protein E [Candidatus Curtissbacteria bacterium GW2011_GWC2_38_9]
MEDKSQVLKSQKAKIDIWLLGATTLLVLIGLLVIYDASVVAAYRDFGDKLYYFKNQLIWASLSFMALGFFSFFNYRKLLRLSLPIMGLAALLLILVLIPHIGTEAYGAKRWINLGSFTFQPSEFAKLAIIFYAASIMVKFENFKISLKDIALVLFLPVFLLTFLVLVEPDLGTSLMFIGIAMVIYFVGRAPLWHFLMLVPVIVAAGVTAIITQPYRLERLRSFIDPSYDPQGASYQISQIITAPETDFPYEGADSRPVAQGDGVQKTPSFPPRIYLGTVNCVKDTIDEFQSLYIHWEPPNRVSRKRCYGCSHTGCGIHRH